MANFTVLLILIDCNHLCRRDLWGANWNRSLVDGTTF